MRAAAYSDSRRKCKPEFLGNAFVSIAAMSSGGEETGIARGAPVREEMIPLVDRWFWVYGEGFGELDEAAFNTTFEELGRDFHPGGPGPVGVCVTVDDRELIEQRPEPVWPGTDLLFAGYLPDGRQLRIRYFWGATIGPGLPDSPSLDEAAARDYTLGPSFRIESLAASGVTEDDVLDMWAREGVLPPPLARERVRQVSLVAITGELEVAGVSSIYLQHNPQLRMDLWYYRTFVAARHRHGNLAAQLIIRNRDLLEQRFTSGEDRRGQGMIFELENEGMRRHLNNAYWPNSDFFFIGENEHGAHVRVHYFPGARVPPPRETPTD